MSITWIEASAGTGKTYTLVKTVLDMIVSGGLPVEQILMVTFTDKATSELKTRIRQGLREAWKTSGDPRLAQALEDLASLSITTIHGFCRMLLTQFPLESGVSFEPEMVDQGRQWRRLLRDELRPRLTTLDAHLLVWAGVEDEEDLLSLAAAALNRNLFSLPLLHPDAREQTLFQTVRRGLEDRTGPLWAALERNLNLPKDSADLGPEVVSRHLHATWHKHPYRVVREFLEAQSFRDLIPLLTAENLTYLEKWNKPYEPKKSIWKADTGGRPPVLQDIAAAASAISEALASWTSALVPGVLPGEFLAGAARHALLEDLCRPVLERRSPRELTFHDLIDRVRSLVTGPLGSRLVQGAAGRWKAVLIDEFQDTDPEQWEIFRTLFAGPDHRLVLVGDPKQSIYRFRGADLDVYRAVRNEVLAAGARSLVLDENFRSTEAMVEAVNGVFDPSRTPWDYPDDFLPSRKGLKAIAQLVRLQDGAWTAVPPLAVYREAAEPAWHRHLVSAAAELLNGNYALDDGTGPVPVTAGDILILVRKKKEAWSLYRALTARGIPSTVAGSGGLLAGREAQEILLFLKALEQPRSLPAARALTWTRLFAGADLDRLMPALAEAETDRDRGAFLRAFRRVAAALEPGVADGGGLERLLALAEGPRMVTNAEHVLELVQERHHRGDVPPGRAALSLETWIGSRLQEDEVDLRQDRETKTLRLMTVHAAKGLEAPIVLHGLPSASPRDKSPWIVAGGVDYLKCQASRETEERNQAAEELRLRYVALTRARTHQVFVDPSLPVALAVPEPVRASLPRLKAETDRGRVPELEDALKGLEARHPWVESHSGLWRRATRDEAVEKTVWDRPVVHRDDEGVTAPGEATDTLPAGPVFGDLVHDILETADFRAFGPAAPGEDRRAAAALVEEFCQRNRAAFRGQNLTPLLAAWLTQTLNHPFALDEGEPPLVFSSLAREDTRRELEFHLPLALGAPTSFDWGSRLLSVHPGYLTGRIDLLFQREGRLYLVDWKTNRLAPGQTPGDVMAEAGYDLQAQWYWEALNRLNRLQNETLVPGGVLYVFLRGAGTQPSGVFLSPETLNRRLILRPFLREVLYG